MRPCDQRLLDCMNATCKGPVSWDEVIDGVHAHNKDMADLQKRIDSFGEITQGPTKEELANGGFYHIEGDNGRTMCYFCGLMLLNWQNTDNVWGEHKRYRESCMLIVKYCS